MPATCLCLAERLHVLIEPLPNVHEPRPRFCVIDSHSALLHGLQTRATFRKYEAYQNRHCRLVEAWHSQAKAISQEARTVGLVHQPLAFCQALGVNLLQPFLTNPMCAYKCLASKGCHKLHAVSRENQIAQSIFSPHRDLCGRTQSDTLICSSRPAPLAHEEVVRPPTVPLLCFLPSRSCSLSHSQPLSLSRGGQDPPSQGLLAPPAPASVESSALAAPASPPRRLPVGVQPTGSQQRVPVPCMS